MTETHFRNRQLPDPDEMEEAAELWILIDQAEEADLMREAMELRRLFAEDTHRLDAGSLKQLAGIAERAGLEQAARWCRTEAARRPTTPGFMKRLQRMLDGGDRQDSARADGPDGSRSAR